MSFEKDPSIIIRDPIDGDEESLAVLLHNNFPNSPAPAVIHKTWRWQFRNAFSRNSGVAVAERDGDIVAQYAVMWFPMIYKGQQIDGAVSTATVTDKSVRGQGLFTKLAVKVYQDIAAESAKIIYGFPNSQSINGFIKHLEWFEVAPFPLYIKPVDTTALVRKIIGDNAVARVLGSLGNCFFRHIVGALQTRHRQTNITFRQVHDIPDALDKIWDTTCIAGKIALVRNKRYLRWRYMEKPFFSYDIHVAMAANEKLCGCIITRIGEKFGVKIIYVMEILAENDDPAVTQLLLDELNSIAIRQGAAAISLLFLPDNPNRSLYLKNGYLPVPRRLFPQDIFFGARVNSPDIDPKYARDMKNWYISWGDLDVV
jgi:hypothetical protein